MIGFIRGNFYSTNGDLILVDVGGVGYEICATLSVLDNLPEAGEEIFVYTNYVVREDSATLYGFSTALEKSLFEKLITVSGVGPKGAISVLSTLSADDLIFAVTASDSAAIAKANGIGKKTAEKICIDLKDKLKIEDTFIGEEMSVNQTKSKKDSISKQLVSEAYSYLENLGFGSKDIMPVLSKLKIVDTMSVEEIISMALGAMDK